ncbi:hypothetical protein B0T18DRAFT_486311 [Schizothecium vesticola]|uniref:Protein kinase domain-containing protein n=1 Tax=Schizothecium vesticola TaxID=314040 RepID=A0AA40F5Z9_9PEZI|nr:hypothetical protein B0T18DRAFT_486311 [Schizothecium vesticola]
MEQADFRFLASQASFGAATSTGPSAGTLPSMMATPEGGSNSRGGLRQRTAGPDVTAVEITLGGDILSISRDADGDATPYVPYASPDSYGLPFDMETVARDQLVELGRLAPWVDVVTTRQSTRSEKLVFKHYSDTDGIPRVWWEVQWLARLSGHPHAIPLRHLVVVEGSERRVVGFTVPFLPGGSLEASRKTRPFKLKWAQQLCQVVDDLNLQHGIAHTDVRSRNIMVNSATDNLVLLDFGSAARRGKISQRGSYFPPSLSTGPLMFMLEYTRIDAPLNEPQPGHATLEREGEEPYDPSIPDYTRIDAPPNEPQPGHAALGREGEEPNDLAMLANHDVASVITLVYDLVTLSAAGDVERGTNALYCNLLNGPWIAHPDALLDHPADDYRVVLVDWLARRRADPGHYLDHADAPQAFAFPDHMPMPTAEEVQDITNKELAPGKFLRRDAVRAGRAAVNWARPATIALDRSRTLLATGEYLDDTADEREGRRQGAKRRAKRGTMAKNRPSFPRRQSPRVAALLKKASPK